MPRAIFIHILKQFRTRKVAAVLEDARQLTIANNAMIVDVALREKIEFDARAQCRLSESTRRRDSG